jgi:serine/threonine-protein kinase
MAPEQIRGSEPDRRVDIFAAGVVLWELLTGRRFADGVPEYRMNFILSGAFKRPSEVNPLLPVALDDVVMKALESAPEDRYQTAEDFARALAGAGTAAASFETAAWVRGLMAPFLSERAALVRSAEHASVPPLEAPVYSPPETEETQFDDSSIRRVLGASETAEPLEVPRLGSSLAPPEMPSRKRAWLFFGILFLSLVMMALWLGLHSMSPEVAVRAPAPAEPRKAEVATSPPVATVLRTETPPPPPSPSPAQKPTLTKRSTTKLAPLDDTEAVPVKKAADPCAPPYVLLEGGIKKYKPECL